MNPEQPEDLAEFGIDVTAEDWMRTWKLKEIRRIYREAPWWLTVEEEVDLAEDCRNDKELCIAIYVYDLIPLRSRRRSCDPVKLKR